MKPIIFCFIIIKNIKIRYNIRHLYKNYTTTKNNKSISQTKINENQC